MVKPRARLEAENIVLRHPLNVLRPAAPKVDLEAHLRCPHIDRFRTRAGELLAEPPGITLWTQYQLGAASPFLPAFVDASAQSLRRFLQIRLASKSCEAAQGGGGSSLQRTLAPEQGTGSVERGEFFRPSP